MKKTISGVALSAMLFALCLSVEAQQSKKVARIGYLSVLSPASDFARIEAFRQGLRQAGYADGQNIAIESRYAEGKLDRLPDLAGELVRLQVDVIVVGGSTTTRAAKNATKLIPVVMAHGSDPVELGFVASLARPGGNITGLTHLAPELGGKAPRAAQRNYSPAFPRGCPYGPGHTRPRPANKRAGGRRAGVGSAASTRRSSRAQRFGECFLGNDNRASRCFYRVATTYVGSAPSQDRGPSD